MCGIHGAVALSALLTLAMPVARQAAPSVPAPDAKYDPKRDAAQDIQAALAEARRTNRRVILDVGGEWCGWCHTLDRYFVEHQDLRALRDKHYVWIKVNWSPENRNEAVLSKYGRIDAFPHLVVLEQDGAVLKSQDTGVLEQGSSYNFDRMKEFFTKWAPH